MNFRILSTILLKCANNYFKLIHIVRLATKNDSSRLDKYSSKRNKVRVLFKFTEVWVGTLWIHLFIVSYTQKSEAFLNILIEFKFNIQNSKFAHALLIFKIQTWTWISHFENFHDTSHSLFNKICYNKNKD